MESLDLVQRIAIWLLPVLFAITVHEVAHGWVASKLGDPTALMLGRLTLNPIKHIDPVGTILVPGAMLLLSGFVFGWARPVLVTYQNLKSPKRDMAFVALAGPGANLLMALLWALVIKLAIVLWPSSQWAALPLLHMGVAGIFINVILMVLNLLPLPPLDGGRVLTGVLPGPLAWKVSQLEPYGLFILVGLLVTGILGTIVSPPIIWLQGMISQMVGLPPEVFHQIRLSLMGL